MEGIGFKGMDAQAEYRLVQSQASKGFERADN